MLGGGHYRKEPSSHRQQPSKKFEVKRLHGSEVIWRKPNSIWLPSHHLGCRAAAIIERNFPLIESNHQKKFRVKYLNSSQVIWWNQNVKQTLTQGRRHNAPRDLDWSGDIKCQSLRSAVQKLWLKFNQLVQNLTSDTVITRFWKFMKSWEYIVSQILCYQPALMLTIQGTLNAILGQEAKMLAHGISTT